MVAGELAGEAVHQSPVDSMVHASWCPTGAPEGREAPKKEGLGKLGTFHLAMSWRIILASVLWSVGPLEWVTAGLHLALGSCVLLTGLKQESGQALSHIELGYLSWSISHECRSLPLLSRTHFLKLFILHQSEPINTVV